MWGRWKRRAFGWWAVFSLGLLSACTAADPAASEPGPVSGGASDVAVLSVGASGSDVLWKSGFESGSTKDFYGVSISGCARVDVVTTPTRTGNHAGALTICDGKGGVRLRVEDLVADVSLPNDAYYSTWFALPEPFTGDDANIFQFKQAVSYDGGKTQTKEVLFSIQADWEEGLGWDLRLKSKINQETGEWDNVQRVLGHSGPAGIYAPVDRWFHIETRYTWSKTGKGRVTVWLDGTQLWDITGITTEMDWPYIERPRQWTLNNYVDYSTPATHTLYIDDAAVALTRQGPRDVDGVR